MKMYQIATQGHLNFLCSRHNITLTIISKSLYCSVFYAFTITDTIDCRVILSNRQPIETANRQIAGHFQSNALFRLFAS